MSPQADPATRRRNLLLFAVAVLAVLGTLWAYAPCRDNFFVSDDYCYLLVGRTLLDDPGMLLQQRPVFQLYVGADMRPLGNLIWAALVAAFGRSPAPYYVLLQLLHLLNAALLWWVLRQWLRDDRVAVVAAALFVTAYGLRNGICWISNLNEELCLTLALAALHVALFGRGWKGNGGLLALLLVGGCLIKESVAPMLVAALVADGLTGEREARGRRLATRWWPAIVAFAVYAAVRLAARREGFYGNFGFGPHTLRSWPALVTYAFTSELLPVYLRRVLQAPELLPLLTGSVTLVVAWLAVRGSVPVRVLATWVLVQPVPFALLPSTTPEQVASRYLYLATAPAMTLVALGLTALWDRLRGRRWGWWLPALLALALMRWTLYGLLRVRQDEQLHWEVASQTLRRDFAMFDAARLPAGTRIVLVLPPPEQRPGGGTWWGWGGYPLFSPVPVTIEEVAAPPAELVPPYAVFEYDQERGPRLVARDDGSAP